MKKFIAAIMLIPVLLFTACHAEETKQVKPADVTAAVLAEVNIASAVEKGKDSIADFYGKMDVSAVKDASFYICGSGAYPDEIAVFQMNSSADAETAKAAVQSRLDERIEQFKTYTPDEMYKLDGAFLIVKGNYVILLACADNDKAREIVNGMF